MQNNDLTKFIDEACADSHLRVEADLGDGFVRLRTDEAERRQAAQDIRSVEDAVIELLRNSRDANARNIYLASSREGSLRRLTVIDDGCGIPSSLHEAVFEPRVTSKLDSAHMDKWGIHGRGMALYSIYVNAKEAFVALSEKGIGTAINVVLDTDAIDERRDQSTFPVFTMSEENRYAIRGPHNIMRVCVEFALEHRSGINVYVGSPSEVAAALFGNAAAFLTHSERVFGSIDDGTLVTSRLGLASTPDGFSDIAESLGLQLSERTSRRILDGEILPAPPLADVVRAQIASQKEAVKPESITNGDPRKRTQKKGDSATCAFAPEDLNRIAQGALRGYRDIADSYYLSKDISPEVRARGGKIIVTLPITSSDDI